MNRICLKLENQIKAFLARELGKKNLIFKNSFDISSPISIVYLAIYSTMDLSLSPKNFVNNFGLLQPLGILAYRT